MDREMIRKNIELSAEFSRFLYDHPEFEEKIPLGTEIIFLPEFDLDLKEFNLRLGKKLETSGNSVVYIKIEKLKARKLSRIEGVSLQPGIWCYRWGKNLEVVAIELNKRDKPNKPYTSWKLTVLRSSIAGKKPEN